MKTTRNNRTRDPSTLSDVQVGPVRIGPTCAFALIAGPCVIESRDHTLRLAESIQKITQSVDVPFIFKASYDKANRSSLKGFRGPGLDSGLKMLGEVRQKLGLPVTSDIHSLEQAAPAGEVRVPVTVGRGPGLSGPVTVELSVARHMQGVSAEAVTIPAEATEGELTLRFAADEMGPFNMPVTLRATLADERGLPVTCETPLVIVGGR